MQKRRARTTGIGRNWVAALECFLGRHVEGITSMRGQPDQAYVGKVTRIIGEPNADEEKSVGQRPSTSIGIIFDEKESDPFWFVPKTAGRGCAKGTIPELRGSHRRFRIMPLQQAPK